MREAEIERGMESGEREKRGEREREREREEREREREKERETGERGAEKREGGEELREIETERGRWPQTTQLSDTNKKRQTEDRDQKKERKKAETETEREKDGLRRHSHQTYTHKMTEGGRDGGSGSEEGKIKGLTGSDALASVAIKEAWAGAAVEAFAGRRQVKASHPGEARAAQTRVQFCSREPKTRWSGGPVLIFDAHLTT